MSTTPAPTAESITEVLEVLEVREGRVTIGKNTYPGYTISGDLRELYTDEEHFDTNHGWSRAIQRHLTAGHSGVEFDAEYSSFYGYAGSAALKDVVINAAATVLDNIKAAQTAYNATIAGLTGN